MGEEVEAVTSGGGLLEPGSTAEPTGGVETERHNRFAVSAIYGISVILAGAALAIVAGPLHTMGPVRSLFPQPQMFVIVTSVFIAGLLAPVTLHYRGNSSTFALDSIPLILGLVFLRPSLLVLSAICSEIVFSVVHKRPIIKTAFNVALVAFTTAVSALIYREILRSGSPVSFRGWAAAATALVAGSLTALVAIRVAAKVHGQPAEHRTGWQVGFEAMLIAASVCLALVVLDTAWFDLWATVPLLLVGALIIVAYRGYTRLTLRFGALQRLYDSNQALGLANLEPSSMSGDVLRQVCTVMRARRAQLVLAEPTGIPRQITLDRRGSSEVEIINLDEDSFVTQTITTGEASLHSRTTSQTRKAGDDSIAGKYRTAVVAPLTGENAVIGAIVAVDRDEEEDEFDEDDLRLFEALVANAGANLEHARLVEDLRYEAAAKEYQATHDSLTGLPNRKLFEQRAMLALHEFKGVAVVLLDLDRFKDVNDTLGHPVGDSLLIHLSERLSRAVPGHATVARFGGDEFALLITDVTDVRKAVKIVDELHSVLSRPIEMEGLTLAVTASAGIALAPEHGDDVDLLLQRADIAMYLAKERRSTVEIYSVEHDQSMRRWLMLGGLLTHTLESRTELSVVYHAIGDVRSHKIVQVEALTRWNHSEQGAIPPDEFHRDRRANGNDQSDHGLRTLRGVCASGPMASGRPGGERCGQHLWTRAGRREPC